MKVISILIALTTLAGCCSKHNHITDPLPTYWEQRINTKDYNDINKQLQDKLNEIDEQIERLKQPDWHDHVHAIYGNIQQIREVPVVPMQTASSDDI